MENTIAEPIMEGADRIAELTITAEQAKVLRAMADRYVWWKSAEDALRYPRQIIAQVMNIGDWEDVQIVARSLGDAVLRSVIENAEAGQFTERSWAYWHYRLHLAKLGSLPPLPARRIA